MDGIAHEVALAGEPVREESGVTGFVEGSPG
jgi:hypothetical protein